MTMIVMTMMGVTMVVMTMAVMTMMVMTVDRNDDGGSDGDGNHDGGSDDDGSDDSKLRKLNSWAFAEYFHLVDSCDIWLSEDIRSPREEINNKKTRKTKATSMF